jgi:hypothetical protein
MSTVIQCPKCGIAGSFCFRWIPPGHIEVVHGVTLTGECMARSCGTCNYTFSEPIAGES